MLFYLVAGAISACAILFLLFKFNIKRMLRYDILIDISSTALLMILFQGTYAGMMAAIVGGAIISIVLFMLKKVIGYDKLVRHGYKLRWEHFSK